MAKDTQEREEAILQAAIKVFSEKGYSGATTKEIADEAGVSVGTLFRHFPNKEEILNGLLIEIIKNIMPKMLVESLETIFKEYMGATPDKTLLAFIDSRVDILIEHYEILKVVSLEAIYNAELRETLIERVYLPIQNILRNFIRNGIESGYFRNIDEKIAAKYISGSLIFLALNLKSQRKENLKAEIDQVKNQIVNILLNGIAVERQSSP
ncbi:MAG: TetR/AcrR family transcriptional regulator [Syntrophomonadaceae bacterium]|nr:TetR/AcrR family transcriptional regulator [Syntrophomonadaceae bacterium]MDD3022816.1 TetR/AcrR family transcriptional regulator [Syntrophomonadaceae bacterium]